MEKDYYDIVILDSGIEVSHSVFSRHISNITAFSLFRNDTNKVVKKETIDDQIGHGTAVTSIIFRLKPDAKVCMIKIFYDELWIDELDFLDVLEWVSQNINSRILHLSCGICECIYKKRMKTICDEIRKKGTVIVAAFDNYGSLSYPAAFENVIGVDLSQRCTHINQMIYVGNAEVNIRAFGVTQKVAWINNSYKYVASSSFCAPLVSIKVLNLLDAGYCSFDILSALKKECTDIMDRDETYPGSVPHIFDIQNAIIFPFNKEIHSILRFWDSCPFNIQGFYEHQFLLSKSKTIFNKIQGNNSKYKLLSWNKIDWNQNFDTIIVGHVGHLSDILNYDILKKILELCIAYHKNIVSFDSLMSYSNELKEMNEISKNAYYPHIMAPIFPTRLFGKLPHISRPVLCICGTSKRQGKFSLQMNIRRKMEALGFNVGHLSTEPSGEILGANLCYPMGFEGQVNDDPSIAISNVRYMMNIINDTSPDIIITGTQSQTVPITYGNAFNIPYRNYLYLNGVCPDAILIVINIDDSIEYILQTINYCNSITEGEVIGLVISPLHQYGRWSIIGGEFQNVSDEECEEYQVMLKSRFKLPVFNFQEIDKICERIIGYFQEE